MAPSFRPADFDRPEGASDHAWCLATKLCRTCGASQRAVASGERRPWCEPGVTGISWTRAAERIRDEVSRNFYAAFGPMADLPLYTLETLPRDSLIISPGLRDQLRASLDQPPDDLPRCGSVWTPDDDPPPGAA